MIIGIGCDIIDIRRIEKLLETSGEKFIARTFTPIEQKLANTRANGGLTAAAYAKRYAAKEACAKALGTAIRGGITFLDFETSNEENGKPVLTLSGEAANTLQRLVPEGKTAIMHLSLSDDMPYAQAFVTIEAI